MPKTPIEVEIFGQSISYYIERSARPWSILSGILALFYIGSFWLEVSYLNLMAPLALIGLIVMAVFTSYNFIRQGEYNWRQVVMTCIFIGVGAGLVSAFLAFIRFWYIWLFFNLVTEPVWSGLLAGAISVLTIGFFQLPQAFAKLKRLS